MSASTYIYIYIHYNTQHFPPFSWEKKVRLFGGFFPNIFWKKKVRFDSLGPQGGLFPTFPFCRDWWRDILEVCHRWLVKRIRSRNVIILFGGELGVAFLCQQEHWLVVSNIFIFTFTWGNDPIWQTYFSKGLVKNHQPELMDFPFVDWIGRKTCVKPTAWWFDVLKGT